MIIRRQSSRNLLTSFRDSTSFLLNSMMLRSVATSIVVDFNGRKFSSLSEIKFLKLPPIDDIA